MPNPDGTSDTILVVLNGGDNLDWATQTIGAPRSEWLTRYTDAIKCTNHQSNIHARLGTVYSGTENCVDINNGASDIWLNADLWVANGGKYPFTIKGGATNVRIYGRLEGHGKECDVDAGNQSDQSREWVRDWELGLTSTDGSPIKVRCLAAETPRLVSGTGPYVFLFPDSRKWYHCKALINVILNLVRLGWL